MALLVFWISLQPDSLIFLLGESAKVSDMSMDEANGVCWLWLFRPIGASNQSSNFVTNDLTVLFTDMLFPLPINVPVLLAFLSRFQVNLCVLRLQYCQLHHPSPGHTAHLPPVLLSLPVPLPPVLSHSIFLFGKSSSSLAFPDPALLDL